MIKDKKVIGVCLTKIHDITRSNYINYLYHLVTKQGYKMMVFNSFVDFYHNDAFDEGARAVYDIINYDIIDVLIIYVESFCNKEIYETVIARAKEKSVPVILLNEEREGCYSIVKEYEEPYKAVIRHIIKEHGATDTLFMAGRKENDDISKYRIQCYKDVLEENGLTFEEDRVRYGDYWEWPTRCTMQEFLDSGHKLPQAIICANDEMAYTVCRVLEEYGYHVPEDVLVTGFDGVPATRYCIPLLTTCEENLEGLAEKSLEAVKMAFANEKSCCTLKNEYIYRIAESCGCKTNSQEDSYRIVAQLYRTVEDMEKHEEIMYSGIDCMLGIKDMDSMYQNLANCILEHSYVCLCDSFEGICDEDDREETENKLSDELLVISTKENGDRIERLMLKEMVPGLEHWAEDDTMFVLTAVYAGREKCGYYAVKTDDIVKCKHKIKRISKTINVACNVSVNYLRQMKLKHSVESATLVNSITKLPNFKGTVQWFEKFSALEANHNRPITISVYNLPKYTYIYENYGVEDMEEVICFVADALKTANPEKCFIGHIAEDTFVIINYYEEMSQISDTINSATAIFFRMADGYNSNSDKEYYVEVNCGCTEISPGWSGSIEGFIKFANSEMYMNRLKMTPGPIVKEKTVPKDHYKTLELLIGKNLFHYHFQPIVNVSDGDIYGYEALMRTDAAIGMNPFEILAAAKEYNCLYDIEKATMFNVMELFSKENEKFGQRKIFINSIPGYFLKEKDVEKIFDKYGSYISSIVIELTEQDTVSDEEIKHIRIMNGDDTKGLIAIDDYGTGHSNIVNLMRYAPQIIKIDRFLISDIHKEKNKQMFVRSTIEFAQMNNIKVLAEGVETSEELRTVIELGVDLIQGYYTGRPMAEPITVIAEDVRKEILDANKMFGKNM